MLGRVSSLRGELCRRPSVLTAADSRVTAGLLADEWLRLMQDSRFWGLNGTRRIPWNCAPIAHACAVLGVPCSTRLAGQLGPREDEEMRKLAARFQAGLDRVGNATVEVARRIGSAADDWRALDFVVFSYVELLASTFIPVLRVPQYIAQCLAAPRVMQH